MARSHTSFTRSLLSTVIASVIAASAHSADVVINTTVSGHQEYQSDTTAITVTATGSVTASGSLDDAISLDGSGHALSKIEVLDGGTVSAGWDAIYTGDEGANSIGFISIAGDLFSTGYAGGIGVSIDSDTTVNGNVTITSTGSFTGSGTVCEASGLTANQCGVNQSGIMLNGTVNGDIINNGTIDARNGLVILGAIEESTGNTFAGTLNGDLINNGTITVSPGDGAGLAVYSGATVTGNVENTATITATSSGASGIKITGAAVDYNDTLAPDGDVEGLITGTAQAVVQGSVINSGTIDAEFDGIALQDNVLIGGDVINSGTIDVSDGIDGDAAAIYVGDDDDVAGTLPTVTGDIINSGTLISDTTGQIDDGVLTPAADRIATVELDGSYNSFINLEGGVIRNIDTQGTAIRSHDANANLNNGGSIEGVVRMTGGSFTNTGSGSAESVIGADTVVISGGTIDSVSDSSTVTVSGGVIDNVSSSSTVAISSGTINSLSGANTVAISGGTITSANGGDTVTINGGQITNLSNAGTVTFNASSASDISNSTTVHANSFSVGSLSGVGTINSTGASFTGISGATHLNIAQSGSGTQTVTNVAGNLTFAGTLSIDAVGIDVPEVSKDPLDLNDTITGSRLSVGGTADLTGATINMRVTGDTFIDEGDEFIFADAASLTSDATRATDNSALLAFDVEQRGNTLVAIAAQGDATEVLDQLEGGSTENTQQVGQAINQLTEELGAGDIDPSSELGEMVTELQAVSEEEFVAAVESLQPEATGSTSGATSADNAAASTINNRQASLRAPIMSGLAAGDEASAINGVWGQLYDSNTDQDTIDDVDGFDADTYGIAVGFDMPLNENTNIGMAFSYANTDMDSKGTEGNSMEIDSFRLTGYGSYNAEDYYLDAQVSYARNQYDGKRHLFNGLVATNDHDGDQYSVRLRGGYPMAFDNGIYFTPKASLEYTYLSEDKYDEKGAGNAGLNVDVKDVEALVAGIGGEISYAFSTDNYTLIPEFHMMVQHDFIGDEVEVDSNFLGAASAAFITEGANAEQTGINSGIGLRIFGESNLSIALRYDYLYKKDYNSQSYSATMRYDF